MFVLMYIDTGENISVIQGSTLEKVNKKIRTAVQKGDMDVDTIDNGDWELYVFGSGELVKYENYAFLNVPQFL